MALARGRIRGRIRIAAVVAVALALAAGSAHAKDETLQEAQNILLMLGFKPGKSDGNARPQTTQALTEFQRANKLPASGKLDDATMAALRNIRDTKFTGSLGTPPANAPPKKLAVEPKPQAAPVDSVNAGALEAAPGTRVLGGSSSFASSGPAIPPPLFGSGASAPSNPAYPPGSFNSPSSGPAEQRPFLGIVSWTWALPFLGIPVFGFLWWYGMRRQGGTPDGETELMEHRREPNMEKAAAAPTRGRREPTL
jgi:peptidoglycan hydrolase-like protein with peptidoglycan-binding domain